MRARRRVGPLVLTAALVLAMVGTAGADEDPRVERERPAPWDLEDLPSSGGFVDDLWFVEYAGEPTARGGSPAAQADERAAMRSEATAEELAVVGERDFGTLFNGETVRADAADANHLRGLDSVEAVHPVGLVERPDPTDAAPELSSALAMTGADTAQSELELDGHGVSVAIIDTGIDYNHPDLGGEGEEDRRIDVDDDRTLEGNARISHGWDYVGDEFNPADPDAPQDPAPNPDPMDPQGHGTHVAGITGADAADDEGVTGVAPGVTFGAYKVFGPGSTSSDVIVDALEDAYEDGMDIVNMSLGAAFAWGQDYPTTQASNELADQGVVVVNSAGNSGGDGKWTLSAPANAHDIISVASADNTSQQTQVFESDAVEGPIPYLGMSDAPAPPSEGESEPLIDAGRACLAEGDTIPDEVDGNVALIVRGDCTFNEKYQAAVDAGATGVVIYNNVSGLFAGGGIERDEPWAAGISNSSGEALLDAIEAGETVTLEFTDDTVETPNPTGGLVSSFSSYGQEVELEFGPSVLAPGGLITSTYPLELGGYAMLSGTSMAAPHVAGAVALLLESEPDLDPFEVRDRLQNTSDQVEWSAAPGAGYVEKVIRQGAGMIRIDEAITADQHVVPGQLSLGDEDQVTTTVTVTNRSDAEVTYDVGHVQALEAGISTYAPLAFLPAAELEAPETVTVPAGGSEEVEMTITSPNSGLPNLQYGGYVTMTTEDGEATPLSVPYLGYDGDYVDEMGLLGAWTDGEDGPTFVDVDPVLTTIDEENEVVLVDEGHTYSIRDDDQPTIQAFFGHYPERLEVYAVDQRSGDRRLVLEDEYLPRSPQPGDFWAFPWDGTTQAGSSDGRRPLPRGEYVLELQVLRATGDPDNEEHWDTWESPSFELDSRRDGPPSGTPGGPGNGGPGNGR